jgi:hypothetical protein
VDQGDREGRVEEDSRLKQELFTLMEELNICPEFQVYLNMMYSVSIMKNEKCNI